MKRVWMLAAVGLWVAGCVPGGEGTGPEPEPEEPRTLEAFERVHLSSLEQAENFQRASRSIDLGRGPFERATLLVELESPCYPFWKWREPGAIPSGHNWPAACDAYDRTFSFQLRPKEEGTPGVELVRAITPFGGPMQFEVDLTDLLNGGFAGQQTIETSIDTWPDGAGRVSGSQGGWYVSARFDLVPGIPPRKVLAAIPLFNTSFSGPGENAEFGPYPVEVPEGTRQAKLEVRATGHGGGPADGACIGHADEFCKRTHDVWVDDRQVASSVPWVECADGCTVVDDDPAAPFEYCRENPCGHPASAVAPRANWCPGKVTPPQVVEHPFLQDPGERQVRWKINRIADGGSWRMSAIYFAYGD